MKLLAIDPGNTRSAWAMLDDGGHLSGFDITENARLLTLFSTYSFVSGADEIAIEYFQPRGMPTAKEEMETIFWSGRIVQAAGKPWHPITRMQEKIAVCGNSRAKDGNIRQALIDLYGGPDAIGKKKTPGPLYGVSNDVWQALAIGVTWMRGKERFGEMWKPTLKGPEASQ